MIEKEIKEYTQGSKTIQRINILKQDNIKGTVFILKPDEYSSLLNENKQQKETIAKQNEKLEKVQVIVKENEKFINKMEKRDERIFKLVEKIDMGKLDQLLEQNEKHISDVKEVNEHHDNTIKELNKENTTQLKESQDQYNKDLKKFILANQLQHQTIKELEKLGTFDILLNKHKEIINKSLKNEIIEDIRKEMLKEDKKVYELAPKKE